MTTQQDPTAWFDQFIPSRPDGWEHDQWCWRHWAPAPVYGANGFHAVLDVLGAGIELMPQDASAEERNQWMRETGPLCCRLGDRRMYEIWGACPPVQAAESVGYCELCDTDMHRCPGCGQPVPHGTTACRPCNDPEGAPRPDTTEEH